MCYACTRQGYGISLTELLLLAQAFINCSRVGDGLTLLLIDLGDHGLHLSVIFDNLGEPIVLWLEDLTLRVTLSGMNGGHGVLHFLEEIIDDLWLLLIDRVQPSLADFIDDFAHIIRAQLG